MNFKFIFVPLLEQGHLQICFALGKCLLFKNPKNEIYFITDYETSKIIKSKCTRFNTLIIERPKCKTIENGRKDNLDSCLMENEERFKRNLSNSISLINKWKLVQDDISKFIHQIKPDLILIENICSLPFIMKMNYKYVQIVSTNPLLILDQINYPPICSGIKKKSKIYTEIYKEYTANFRDQINQWYKEFGLIRQPSLSYIQPSPWFNVLLYPRMLNYFDPQEDLRYGNWFQLSSTIVRAEVDKFIEDQGWTMTEKVIGKEILTKDFLAKPGKLVLFSLGTVVSQNVKLFQKIIPILGDCPHKFIVSKGKFGDQIELPPNCVGSNHLNQLELLPIVDVFCTHGGNNSFVEGCFYAKSMIIMPGYADQNDNAARLEMFNLGKKINLKDLTKEELCLAIEFVSNDQTIRRKMKELSETMQKDNSIDELCNLIIETCSNDF